VTDQKRILFLINEFYVLRLSFNRRGSLTQLAVDPKYVYELDHPEWAEPDSFPFLPKIEYERLVAEMDRIKPMGPLVKPASAISIVTNMTAWHRETHRRGLLEWGEVMDWDRAPDTPYLVRWFRVYYSNRAT
jgi:hypothetical protein